MAVEVTPEAACPIHGIEEANDDAAMDFLFNALEAGTAAEELVESAILLDGVQRTGSARTEKRLLTSSSCCR